jgi:hypothetical protein
MIAEVGVAVWQAAFDTGARPDSVQHDAS